MGKVEIWVGEKVGDWGDGNQTCSVGAGRAGGGGPVGFRPGVVPPRVEPYVAGDAPCAGHRLARRIGAVCC
jgi:hypothetical protein